jgi:PAS domain S-box-containing protein
MHPVTRSAAPPFGLLHAVAKSERPLWLRYGLALVAVALALVLTWLLPPIRTGTPFMLFFLAVTVSALVGGLRAGLVAVALSLVVTGIWVMPPVGALLVTGDEFFQLFGFGVVATLICLLVNALHRANQTSYEQEEWLHTTLSSIGDAVIATDRAGRVVWMNPVAEQLTGWQSDDALGKPLRQVFHIVNESTRLPVENPAERALAEGRIIGLANHTVLIAKDGTERFIDDSAAPIRTARGELQGAVLTFHDISERRSRELSLQLAEQRLRLATDAGRMVVWEWDIVQDRVQTTSTFAEIAGIDGSKVTPRTVSMIHADDRARHQAAVDQIVKEGQSYHHEFRVVRPDDGKTVWIEEWASPVANGDGKIDRVVGVALDISTRKESEEEIRRLNIELEGRVAERTAELEAINRELVEFSNVVSHDLRSPLRAISLLSSWISEESGETLPAGAQDHLRKIQQRVVRMEALLNDLMAYTRAGRVRYPVGQVDTAELVRDVINLLDVPTSFAVNVVGPMPRLLTERVPLETVLRHLLGNAVKHHHHPEGGHATVAARDLGAWIEFGVADDGPGIEVAHQARIFGVFQTLRPRDEVEGSGMGLATAKRLVEGRGGRIWVESQPGQGSTFCFTWPKSSEV